MVSKLVGRLWYLPLRNFEILPLSVVGEWSIVFRYCWCLKEKCGHKERPILEGL